MTGYEYVVVGFCERTGKPIVAPVAWSTKAVERPYYYTCTCHGRGR